MDFPNGERKKYQIIYADPPWQFNRRKDKRGVEAHYPTIGLNDLKALPVKQISDKNCILFIWCVFPVLQEGLELIDAWGFEYKTIGFNWVKRWKNASWFMGMGNWTRSNSEICLIGTKGAPKRLDASVNQVVDYPFTVHSKKPDIVRQRIVRLCGDLRRIELFARTRVHGWDVWGNDEKLELLPLEKFA